MPIERQSVRAILIDERHRLILIKRTKPERAPYWTAPGGGVEDSDATHEAALHRELAEELGANAEVAARAFLLSSPTPSGVSVQHFYLARLTNLDLGKRDGPEFNDPSRGGYDLDRIDLSGDDLTAIDLKPNELKDFILNNREILLAEAATTRRRIGRSEST